VPRGSVNYVWVRAGALGSGLCFVVVVVRPWSATVGKSSSVFIAWTVLRAAALASRVSLYRAPRFSKLRVGSCWRPRWQAVLRRYLCTAMVCDSRQVQWRIYRLDCVKSSSVSDSGVAVSCPVVQSTTCGFVLAPSVAGCASSLPSYGRVLRQSASPVAYLSLGLC